MVILSNVLYIYAFYSNSLYVLLFSRFLYGLGGSKVVHRKYIANFIQKTKWSKYYSRLVLTSFTGMSTGPVAFLAMIWLRVNYPAYVPEEFI
jgi:hypothetical protein